ncbi:hypothetical protein [Williamsia deligens]|uniref:Integral membrane protein n=1 Tax=Williamsia deligens TaxID=321325 RepID=A0ABW3GBD6_9NOCA|nr:hypothetical protein [Williamsia deligens]MCP2193125.1 hypothetical protein [Williamsia deligens]
MRTLVAGLATLVAIVAMVVALPALWTHERIVDRSGFIGFVEPMAHDRQIQDLIADELTRQITDQTDAPSILVEPATRRYTRSDLFPPDFADVLGQQHDFLFTEPTTDAERSGVLELDLTEMVNRVIARFGLPSSIRLDGPIRIPLGESQRDGLEAGRYAHTGDQVTRTGWLALAVVVIAGLLALMAARRRGTTLALLGVGAVISAAVSWGATGILRNRALDEFSGADSSPRQVARIILDRAGDDLQHTALITGGVGVAVIAVGILGSLLLERRRR